MQVVETTARFAEELSAGAAVSLLLQEAKIRTGDKFAISARPFKGEDALPEETQPLLAVFTGKNIYKAAILRTAAVLLSPDGSQQIATVSRDQIEAHRKLKDV